MFLFNYSVPSCCPCHLGTGTLFSFVMAFSRSVSLFLTFLPYTLLFQHIQSGIFKYLSHFSPRTFQWLSIFLIIKSKVMYIRPFSPSLIFSSLAHSVLVTLAWLFLELKQRILLFPLPAPLSYYRFYLQCFFISFSL